TSAGRTFANILYVLKKLWSLNPLFVIGNFALVFTEIPSRLFNVLIIKYIVDEAVKGVSFFNIVRWGSLFLLFELVLVVTKHVFTHRYKQPTEERIKAKIKEELFRKTVELDISCYDDDNFYNQYIKALNASNTAIFNVFNDLVKFTSALLSVGTLASVIIILNPAVIFVAIFSSVCSLLTRSMTGTVKYRHEKERIPVERKIGYITGLFFSRGTSKDLRLEKLPGLAVKIHESEYTKNVELAKKYGAKYALLNIFSEFPLDLGDMVLWLYIAYGIFRGTLQAGDFMALSNAGWSLANQLRHIFDAMPRIIENGLYIENIRILAAKTSALSRRGNRLVPRATTYTITVRDVSFSYDNKKTVLDHINVQCATGQRIAIVGQNGAGKSTFIKLLLRLYDPAAGELMLNGLNYNEYDLDSLRSLFSVVFQDYNYYSFTIAENILMKAPESDGERAQAWDVLKKVGLFDKVSSLPLGLDTPVTREFSDQGILFSGGEFQKLAIARALVKDTPIVLMDEPSSSLDPLSEHEIEQLLGSLFVNKLVFVISHRLSLTKNADTILLFSNGRISERGTHGELLSLGAQYAGMWNLQAEKYNRVVQ
ncbi:MAG: ABC transporter ATP-binding protein/permease, partial [Spirochaetaceae bacterium]|nr:ABC transporter ATP-binding protein/permease [Spirochaetaceae bacterium]